jgi:arylsulfatase A-like enzyme
MGSQGLMGKRVPFEESCRVPFFVRHPHATKRGYKSSTLFAAIDIYPTLCGLAGVPVPAHCAGRDLSDAVLGRPIREPEYIFMISQPEPKRPGAGNVEGQVKKKGRRGGGVINCPPYRGVRTKTHTYIVADTGRWLLYDNVADPFQMHNLVEDESRAALMATLDEKVAGWLHSVNDSFPYAAATKSVFSQA